MLRGGQQSESSSGSRSPQTAAMTSRNLRNSARAQRNQTPCRTLLGRVAFWVSMAEPMGRYVPLTTLILAVLCARGCIVLSVEGLLLTRIGVQEPETPMRRTDASS